LYLFDSLSGLVHRWVASASGSMIRRGRWLWEESAVANI
jgi:hypothetical protein